MKKLWEKEQEKWVRAGWQRYTTYYQKELLAYLKKRSSERQMHVMDLLAEILNEYRKQNK
jgi:hypothetical protein